MNERLRVRVERMAPEGAAIARTIEAPAGKAYPEAGRHGGLPPAGGKIVFVPQGVPGDLLEVEVVQTKGTFTKARIVAVLERGPERITPPCPLHFDPSRRGPACGGCDWQQLVYSAQLRHKREIALDCLRRIAKLPEVPVAETLGSPEWRYRNKVQIPFGLEGGRIVAGFYAQGSHRIVDFEDCPVQPELSVKLALKVKELAQRFRWQIYDEQRGSGWLRHLFLRTNARGKALAALVTRTADFPRRDEFSQELRESFPSLIGLHQNIQPLKTSVILGPEWKRIWGADRIEERLGPLRFLVSAPAFLQVNTAGAEILYKEVERALEGSKFERVYDLYCGVGTITLWVARSCRRVFGIEDNPGAVQDAWKNAELNGIKNARFQAARVESALPRLLGESGAPAAVIVDPPRAGLSESALRLLTHKTIARLVYVSCSPPTFARDAGFLARSGYRLRRVQPVDLFPQTSHCELIGLFTRD